MARRSLSKKETLRLFELHGGTCHLCGLKIQPGEAWEIDHVVEFKLTQDESDENMMPGHKKCHRQKTSDRAGELAKVERIRSKHLGVRKRSRLTHPTKKRTVDGRVVPR